MKNRLKILVLAYALLPGGVAADLVTETAQREVIGFGVQPVNQSATMEKKFVLLIAYLEEQTGYDFELKTYPTDTRSGGYTAAVRGLLSGDTPFTYLTPVTVSQVRYYDEAVEPVVRAVSDGSPTTIGQIAVNIRYVGPEILEKVKTALLQMHTKDLSAIQAIDPKFEKWVPIAWDDYVMGANRVGRLCTCKADRFSH